MTIGSAALDTSKTVTISTGYTLALASDVTQPSRMEPAWTVEYGTAEYNSSYLTAGFTCNGKAITYSNATSPDTLITVKGLKSTATASDITLSGKTVTIGNAALDSNKTVTISTGYTLKLDSDVTQPTSTDAYWTVDNGNARYYSSSSTAGYTSDGSMITYSESKAASQLINITGLKSTATSSDIFFDGAAVTISNAALDSTKTVTISDGYFLRLADDVTQPTSQNAAWTVDNGTAKYNSASSTAGYTCDGSSIYYSSATVGETLVTINNLKSTANAYNLSLEGNVVTVSNAALDSNKTVTISNGYSLKLANDVPKSLTSNSSWTVENGTATYKANVTGGYTCDGSTISYTAASNGSNLITINNLSETATISSISLSGNVVTVSNSALDSTKTVTISSGYTLALASNVPQSTSTGASWSVDKGTAYYKAAYSSAGYICNGSTITYSNGSTTSNLITITGLKSTATVNDISLSGNVVTISNNALDTSKIVTISSGYTLALAGDVVQATNDSDGYICSGSTIIYKSSEDVVQDFTDTNGTQSITNDTNLNTYIYFNSEGGNSAIITESASGEKFVQAGDGGDTLTNYSAIASVSLIGGESDDVIVNGGSHTTINGSGGADTISLVGGAALIQYEENDGSDVIYGVDSNTTINITDGDYSTTLEDKDVLITVGEDSTFKLKDAAGKMFYVQANGKTDSLVVEAAQTVKFNNAKTSATLLSGFDGTFDLADYSTVKTVVGSQNDHDLEILGNTKANRLLGGTGNDNIEGKAGNDYLKGNEGDDTLDGGKGNDTLFGGDGSDIFIYNSGEGNDLILDYTSGSDTLNINGGVIKSASLSGDDVILKIGSAAITLRGANGEEVTIVNEDDEVFDTVFTDSLTVTNSDSTSIKMADMYKTLDASNRTKTTKITGNSKANTIQGGSKADTISGGAGNDSILGNAGNDVLIGDKGNDTLNGGKGNDTLTGGEGKDVFIITGGNGNDVITDYVSGEDKIKISGGVLKSITAGSGSSKDAIFNFSSGKVTIQGAKGKEINYITAAGKAQSTIVGTPPAPLNVTLTNDDSAVYTAKNTIESINAKKRTNAIKITGNKLDNIIYGSTKKDTIYGGNGNDSINGGAGDDKLFGESGNDTLLGGNGADTLTGGKGDDILTGGSGSDVFSYAAGDGNDTITDYTSGDVIKISGSYSKTNKNGNAVVKVGSGSITVLNTAAKNLTITSQKSFNEELGIMNYELSTIMNTDSNLIGEDYKYDFNSNFTKQLKPEIKLTTNKK